MIRQPTPTRIFIPNAVPPYQKAADHRPAMPPEPEFQDRIIGNEEAELLEEEALALREQLLGDQIMRTLELAVVAIFAALVGLFIGFVVWGRP